MKKNIKNYTVYFIKYLSFIPLLCLLIFMTPQPEDEKITNTIKEKVLLNKSTNSDLVQVTLTNKQFNNRKEI